MKASQLRQTFLTFFERHDHALLGNASLLPEHDPSVLFTTAGMHPLVPFLLGEPHPAGKRLANVQKCLRTDDIMEVGDDVHHTFFEMLGNWSLGDYGKEHAIQLAYSFLTEELGLEHERLAVTCFAGDADAPRDEEAAEIWMALGIPRERITFLPKKENWWGPAGSTGPCGPDSEIFYDMAPGGPPGETPATNQTRFWEIWNLVFMQYDKQADGRYVPLPRLNVDTGMGLERTLSILQGVASPYETELFAPLMARLTELAPAPEPYALRVIADHTRAAAFILAEGIVPGNVDQPYVVRRLIRRAVRYGQEVGITGHFLGQLVAPLVAAIGEAYPELAERQEAIRAALAEEEARFQATLQRGRAEFERAVARLGAGPARVLPGDVAFRLYDTYGFPVELTEELARQHGLDVDREGFQAAFAAHQERSRQGAAGRFRGGLAERRPETIRLHTATHLLHAALRQVLGPHVTQRGSNITVERLRFDFAHGGKLSAAELAALEALVNEQIARDLPVTWQEMDVETARAAGALGVFDDRYGEQVKVYAIGDVSLEICGGPHVARTGELGRFRILKEEAVGSGVRRIRATVG
ncbi:MAG: alanine--tRNA ligase [Anaerolineae bacterium]|nr:alanine--tRNA ligase [Anaerolineae bacterium]